MLIPLTPTYEILDKRIYLKEILPLESESAFILVNGNGFIEVA